MDKKDIYLYIKSIKGISSITLGKIIDEVGSVEEIVKLNEKDIYNLKNISLNIKENLVKYISRFNLDEIKETLYKEIYSVYLHKKDEEYPKNLKNIYNPPLLLFYKGDLSIINNSLEYRQWL